MNILWCMVIKKTPPPARRGLLSALRQEVTISARSRGRSFRSMPRGQNPARQEGGLEGVNGNEQQHWTWQEDELPHKQNQIRRNVP